jgi:hypothetical protein
VPSYDWREYRGRGWFERFPQNVRGYTSWRQQRFEQRFDLKAQVETLMEAREHATAGPARPCLFVSHRQADAAPATRIAYVACQEGFDYWLDVLDPTLSGVPGTAVGTTPEQAAAATAAIVEMALLNSSHVLAIITPNTKGSQWVPYEYGRVKSTQVTTLQAACWVDRVAGVSPLPEYLYLGPVLKSETEIKQWLKTELQKHAGRGVSGACNWNALTPAPL